MATLHEHIVARLIRAEAALRVIRDWTLPRPPIVEGEEPLKQGAYYHWGSNPERNYMRDIARLGLDESRPVSNGVNFASECEDAAMLRDSIGEARL